MLKKSKVKNPVKISSSPQVIFRGGSYGTHPLFHASYKRSSFYTEGIYGIQGFRIVMKTKN
jgi:hypothetical protein